MTAFTAAANGNWSDLNGAWGTVTDYPGHIYTITNVTSVSGVGTNIIITVSGSPPYLLNDQVYISGVLGTVEANGYWVVTAAVGSSFHLATAVVGGAASNFQNAYVSGGIARRADTVTIGTTRQVTMDVSADIGLSGANASVAVTISGTTAQLIINSGVTLTWRGDITISATTAPNLTMNAGSNLLHDSQYSATPSTIQYALHHTSNTARTRINGSSGSHCTVSSVTAASALNGYMPADAHVTNCCDTCTYCDFTHFGDATHNCLSMYNAGAAVVVWDHNTFTSCGQVAHVGAASSGYSFTYTNNIHKSSLNAQCFNWANPNNAIGGGVRLVQSNDFDTGWTWTNAKDASILGNVILGSFSGLAVTSQWAAFTDNIVYYNPGSGTQLMTGLGPITNCYFLNNTPSGGNLHGIGNVAGASGFTMSGCIWENPLATSQGGGGFIMAASPNAGTLYQQDHCLYLGTKGNNLGGNVCLVPNGAGSANFTMTNDHNLVFVGTDGAARHEGASFQEASNQAAGCIASFRSNLFYTPSGGTLCWKVWQGFNTTTGGNVDICVAGNLDYNGCGAIGGGAAFDVSNPSDWPSNAYTNPATVGLAGNSYQTPTSTATPGPHDINNIDPLFVWGVNGESAACIETFNFVSVANGGLGNADAGTNAGNIANVLTYFQNAPQTVGVDTVQTRIQNCVSWVKGRWAPTNRTYYNAGHDQTTIGPVAYAGPPPLRNLTGIGV
jgi:hypothetical protein